jgi:hypothetical protein
MPESPDFEQIARVLLDASDGEPGETRIAEQLRLVWNARGAADVEAVTDFTWSQHLPVPSHLMRTIRALDR